MHLTKELTFRNKNSGHAGTCTVQKQSSPRRSLLARANRATVVEPPLCAAHLWNQTIRIKEALIAPPNDERTKKKETNEVINYEACVLDSLLWIFYRIESVIPKISKAEALDT